MVNVHESDYEQYNEYSFHFSLLFFRFLRIERTDLDQFVGHVEERLAFLQDAFWKQQTFQHGAARAGISREQNAFARCGCVQAAPSSGSRTSATAFTASLKPLLPGTSFSSAMMTLTWDGVR